MAQQLKSTFRGGPKEQMITVKLSRQEYMLLDTKANRFSGGNMSDFIREAIKKWIPSKKDLIEVDEETNEPQTASGG